MGKIDRLPAEWNFVPLGKISSFINGDRGKNYPSQDDFVETGIPFINAGHIQDGNIDFESMNYISEERFNLLGSGKVKPDDILYCLRGSLGKTAIVPEISKGAIASSLVIIRPSEKVRTDYLFHFLSSPLGQSEIYKYDNGSSQPNLSATSVKEYQVPLPPIAEQKRIAAILDKAEELRGLRRKALEELDAIAQSIFLETYIEGKKLARNVSLVGIAESTRSSFVNGPFGSDLLTSELQDSGVPVIYIRDIRDGEYQRVSTVYVTHRKAHDLAFCSVQAGDVLISKVGDPPGIAAIYPSSEPSGIVTQDVIRIRLDSGKAVPKYIAAYLNSSVGRRLITGITVRSTRSRFSLGDFKRLQIDLPPLDIQQEFARRVEAIEQLKATHRESLAQLDALFASLQHRAFRGEL